MAKKITAPHSYDPGKGRPKEYLAYLNEREMAYLRSINGNNMERGPRGLPSFPPNDAIGSSSNAGSKGPGGPSGPNSGPSTGGGGNLGGGGQRGPGGPSGPNSGPSRSGSPSTGGGGKGPGGPSGPNSAPSGTRGVGGPSSPMGGQGPSFSRDTRAQQEAQVRDAIKAVKNSPAFRNDVSSGGIRTLSVGPIGTPVNVGPRVTPVKVGAADVGPISISSLAQPRGYTTTFNNQNQVNALRDVMQAQTGFNGLAFTGNPNETVRHLSGEVGITGVGSGQVAQTMINRSLVNSAPTSMGLANYTNNLGDPKQWASIGNEAYKAAVPGGDVSGQVANQAIKELMAGVKAPYATDFRAINQPGGVNTQKVGVDVAGNRFGNFENVTEAQVAALRSANPIASQFDRAPRTSTEPASQAVADVDRPIRSDLGFTTSVKAADVPSGPLMSGPKQIQDRVLSSVTPSGDLRSTTIGSLQDSWRKSGIPEADIKRATDALMNSPTSVISDKYNVLSGISAPKARGPVSGYSGGAFNQESELQQDAIREAIQGSLYARSVSADVNPRRDVVSTGNPNLVGAPINAPLRSAAGTYTQPYDRRKVTPTGNPNMIGVETSRPTGIGTKLGDEVFGPQQYMQSIPSPDSVGVLDGVVQPGSLEQAEQFKNLVNSYTGELPSLKSLTQAYADLQPSVQKYKMAEKIFGRNMADSLAIKAANAAGVGESISQGIRSLGGFVERGLVGALAGQSALARAGVAPMPNIDVEGTQRAKETVERAERVEVVGGLGMMGTYAPDAPRSTSGGDYTPDERDRLYNGPPETTDEDQPPDDVYPKNVRPEVQELMKDIERKNKYGTGVMKTIGRPLAPLDALRGLITGKNTAEADADLKRAYMQGSPAQKAELEAKYPNLTKFAQQAGLDPQLPMSNYESWRERSFGTGGGSGGSTSTTSPGGGRPDIGSGGKNEPPRIRPVEKETPKPPAKPKEAGPRPAIYYKWDLGIGIPSPSDSEYTLYLKYLEEKAAAKAEFA